MGCCSSKPDKNFNNEIKPSDKPPAYSKKVPIGHRKIVKIDDRRELTTISDTERRHSKKSYSLKNRKRSKQLKLPKARTSEDKPISILSKPNKELTPSEKRTLPVKKEDQKKPIDVPVQPALKQESPEEPSSTVIAAAAPVAPLPIAPIAQNMKPPEEISENVQMRPTFVPPATHHPIIPQRQAAYGAPIYAARSYQNYQQPVVLTAYPPPVIMAPYPYFHQQCYFDPYYSGYYGGYGMDDGCFLW